MVRLLLLVRSAVLEAVRGNRQRRGPVEVGVALPTTSSTATGPVVAVPGAAVAVSGPTAAVSAPVVAVSGPVVAVPGTAVAVSGPVVAVSGPTVAVSGAAVVVEARVAARPFRAVPIATSVLSGEPTSTQASFGRILATLAGLPGLAPQPVTTARDPSVSTQFGSWITTVGAVTPGLQPVARCEPAYGMALDWLMCDGLARCAGPGARPFALRLTTRTIDQGPFAEALARQGRDHLRSDVLAGGYRLRAPNRPADLVVVAAGAVMPEALAAIDLLADEGVAATLIDATSAARLFDGWRISRRTAIATARRAADDFHLATLIRGHERTVPIVTVHDAFSREMAWLGSVFGQRTVPVGVAEGDSDGGTPDLPARFRLLPQQLVNAGLVALDHL